MQATVFRYDQQTGAGAVISDAGLVIPFGPAALERSGLRHLRAGQRLTVHLDEEATLEPRIRALTLGSIRG